jgi:hypothetical protein
VIPIVIGTLLAIGVIGTLALVARKAMTRHWQVRTRQAQIDREVLVAERRLHGMASHAFGRMLGAAREVSSDGGDH